MFTVLPLPFIFVEVCISPRGAVRVLIPLVVAKGGHKYLYNLNSAYTASMFEVEVD
jgi:hypothetical protein